jgi:hypothetical protein
MVTAEDLRAFKYTEPFRPFEITLKDGRTVRITDPLGLGWSEEHDIVMFAVGKDAIDWVRFDQVAGVSRAKRDGGRRQRRAS